MTQAAAASTSAFATRRRRRPDRRADFASLGAVGTIHVIRQADHDQCRLPVAQQRIDRFPAGSGHADRYGVERGSRAAHGVAACDADAPGPKIKG